MWSLCSLTSGDVGVGHVRAEESRLALLELHHVEQKHTQHSDIPRVLLIQHDREIHETLLALRNVPLALVPLHELGNALLHLVCRRRHERAKDLLERLLLGVVRRRGCRLEEEWVGRASRGEGERRGELVDQRLGDERLQFGHSEEVQKDKREW